MMFQWFKQATGKVGKGVGSIAITMFDNVLWDFLKESFVPWLGKTTKEKPEVAESMARYVQMHILGRPDPIVLDIFKDALDIVQTQINEDGVSILMERLAELNYDVRAYYKICMVPYPENPADEIQYERAVTLCSQRLHADSAKTQVDWKNYCNVMNFQRKKALTSWEKWKQSREKDWEKVSRWLSKEYSSTEQTLAAMQSDIEEHNQNRSSRLEELRNREARWLPKFPKLRFSWHIRQKDKGEVS